MNSYTFHVKYFLISLFVLASTVLEGNAEFIGVESHGICQVSTEKDDFTDKISHHTIGCQGRSSSDSFGNYVFNAVCSGAEPATFVVFKAGIQFHLEDYIEVKYRFGKDKAEVTRWLWSSGVGAANSSRNTHDTMIKRLSWKAKQRGEKLIFQVGKNKGVIEFTGEEGKAVEEYRKRCSDFL